MGQVYRAHDPRIGRDVAIKVLPAEYAADAERLRRFEQEARATGALNHPNILTLYDVGTADGRPTWSWNCSTARRCAIGIGRGALPPARACEIAAASRAGSRRRTPRDRPSRSEAREHHGHPRRAGEDPRLRHRQAAGAGGRRPIGRTSTTPLHTAPMMVLGTAGYMAPEQVAGCRPTSARTCSRSARSCSRC